MGTSSQLFGFKTDLFVAIIAVAIVAGIPRVSRSDGPTAQSNDARPPSAYPGRVLKRVEGRFGTLEVVDGVLGRAILCNGEVQTLMPTSGLGLVPGTLLRGRDYTELLAYFRPRARRALLIGVGGGLHAQALAAYGITTSGVDVDPAMIALAREYFKLTIDVEIADGRDYLSRTSSRYDGIILDAFVGATPVKHLHTREAFALMAEHLKSNGVLVIHVIGRPQHETTRAVAKTLETVFSHVVAARSGTADETQHIYLFASPQPLPLLPEHRLTLWQYGLTGDELYKVDTCHAVVLSDDHSEQR